MPSPFFASTAAGPVGGLAQVPARPGPHPAVLLVPAPGEGLDAPRIRALCEALAARRVAGWRYEVGAGDPDEALQAVLGVLLADPSVDTRRVALGGFGPGARRAWAARRPDLRAFLLAAPGEDLPELRREGRPVLLIGEGGGPGGPGTTHLLPAGGVEGEVALALAAAWAELALRAP